MMAKHSIIIDGLDLADHESLLVTFHRPSRTWYASVGRLDRQQQREMATGDTADEAFAMLLALLGARVTGTDS